MKTYMTKLTRMVAAGLALFVSAGCRDLLTVENPGLISDESLDNPTVVAPLVVGLASDYAQAMKAVTQRIAEMTFEITAAGPTLDPYTIGVLDANSVDGWWNAMHKARWVAESGVVRIGKLVTDYDKNASAARANMFAGFSNRLLGENVCQAVFDGGKAEPREAHFKRAEDYFTKAATIAQAAGASANDLYLASLAGRASVRAWQGNWSGAVADASLVPATFVYKSLFSANTSREENGFFGDSYRAYYISVFGTPWATAADPRTPWVILRDSKGAVLISRDGRVPMWAQSKYPALDSDIPIASGSEMLLLRAENALRAKDIPGMVTHLNANRTQNKMGPVATPANETAAWELLKFERGATLWLEARRFWDLSRWYADGRDKSLEGRAKCMPIGKTELATNTNLKDLL